MIFDDVAQQNAAVETDHRCSPRLRHFAAAASRAARRISASEAVRSLCGTQPYPCFGVNGLNCGTDDDRMKVIIAFFESIQHEPGSAHSGTSCRVGEVHSTVWRRPLLGLRAASRQLDGLAVRLCFRHGPAGCPAGWPRLLTALRDVLGARRRSRWSVGKAAHSLRNRRLPLPMLPSVCYRFASFVALVP